MPSSPPPPPSSPLPPKSSASEPEIVPNPLIQKIQKFVLAGVVSKNPSLFSSPQYLLICSSFFLLSTTANKMMANGSTNFSFLLEGWCWRCWCDVDGDWHNYLNTQSTHTHTCQLGQNHNGNNIVNWFIVPTQLNLISFALGTDMSHSHPSHTCRTLLHRQNPSLANGFCSEMMGKVYRCNVNLCSNIEHYQIKSFCFSGILPPVTRIPPRCFPNLRIYSWS